jgi:hypothetical protein
MTDIDYYHFGSGLSTSATSYVVRQADSDIYRYLTMGEFCHVFHSRQMGKTSLLNQVVKRLKENEYACARLDLSTTSKATEEQWYAGIAFNLVKELPLRFGDPLTFLKGWWLERDMLSPAQRLGDFLETVVLVQIQQPVVIFFDEIDVVLSLQFSTGDFFALIWRCYQQRALNPAYERLIFVLIGEVMPSDLIPDKRHPPFHIGRAIHLAGFQEHEVELLEQGLVRVAENPKGVVREILRWTGDSHF